jgi:EAL domain-containing protein (putative c-di-GMP-specific phosphodiesterase class I)
MEQLRRIPFPELKIDRALINGAQHSDKSRAILHASANLGKRPVLSVVAVEAVSGWSDNWTATH